MYDWVGLSPLKLYVPAVSHSHTLTHTHIYIHTQTAEHVRGLRPAVARKKFMLEGRRRALDSAWRKLEDIIRKQECTTAPLLEGLRWYREQAKEAVHQRVWMRVLEHFVIFPIEADLPVAPPPPPPHTQPQAQHRQPT